MAAAGGGVVALVVVWKQDLEETGTAAEESLGLGKQDLMNQEKWRELVLSDAIGEEEGKHLRSNFIPLSMCG